MAIEYTSYATNDKVTIFVDRQVIDAPASPENLSASFAAEADLTYVNSTFVFNSETSSIINTILSSNLDMNAATVNFGDGIANDLPASAVVDSVTVLSSSVVVSPIYYSVIRSNGVTDDNLDTTEQDLTKRILKFTGASSSLLDTVDAYVRYYTIS